MATEARAMRPREAIHPEWEMVKEWAKAASRKEKMAEGALYAATMSVIGVVLFSLHRAMENYVMIGTPPF